MSRILPPWRTLLPVEHGSWFMLGFPLVLGLLLRPSWGGGCLGLGALAAFLARTPLRKVLRGPRDPAQLRALLLEGSLAGILGMAALSISGPRFLIPLACATPLVLVALRADLQRAARSLPVELAAQAAFAALAAALVVAGGASSAETFRIWLLVALTGGANLAHVRHLLGRAHGLPPKELGRRRLPVHLLHAGLLAASALFVAPSGWAGLMWTGWTGVLYLRAIVASAPPPARVLGWREGGLSAVGVLLLWGALL
ncbi:YwiC-like family protein [Geothrix sp. 21YS21S-4]|uniref:YwiC-like family protein n=1 Tax=Geothrix sp. 21YS21S-4 TaxID=3068889 RepID=UPI0027B9A971|nr:YwiC-like family protein [Geothrix sp. 21YS21S-4]